MTNPQYPRTSSEELFDFIASLGLEIELDSNASADLNEVLGEVTRWYVDSARATRAKVFAVIEHGSGPASFTSPRFSEFRGLLERSIGRPLPSFEGDALIHYVADALMINADHSASREQAPHLLSLESTGATLYLLRPETVRRVVGADGWLPATLNSPDTEAALNGIYRSQGATPAFNDHVSSGCLVCLATLEKVELQHGLPEGFEHFRRHPVRNAQLEDTTLPGVSRVAIAIPRAPPKKPWWKFV